MKHRLGAGLVISCALAVVGCSNPIVSSSDSTTTQPKTTTGSAASRPECEAVVDSARKLVDDLGGFVSGSVDADRLRADAQELSESLTAARDVVAANAREQWDKAEDELGQAREALEAQPVDIEKVRVSVTNALPLLGQAVRACSPDAEPIPSSVPTSTS